MISTRKSTRRDEKRARIAEMLVMTTLLAVLLSLIPPRANASTRDGAQVDIALPTELGSLTTQTTSNHEVVERGRNGTSVIDTSSTDGVSIYTISDSPAQNHFTYTAKGGAKFALLPDGGAVLLSRSRETLIGTVSAPWAIDAAGQPVSTRFEVVGGSLVQRLRFTPHTIFPVVADPKISYHWWGISAQLSHSEVTKVVKVIVAGGGIGAVARALAISAADPVVLAIVALSAAALNICDWYDKGVIISISYLGLPPSCSPVR